MRTRDRIALLGLFALAAAAGFVALRPASQDATEEGIARTKPEEQAESLRLEGRADPEAESRPPVEPPRPTSTAAGALTVRGRVTGATSLPPGSHLRILERFQGTEALRVRRLLDASGSFEEEIRDLSGPGPWDLVVQTWVPGRAHGESLLTSVDAADVEVELPTEGTLLARVVDTEGSPIPGLAVLVSREHAGPRMDTRALPDPRDPTALRSWNAHWVGTAVTGEDGRFAFVGVGRVPITVVSLADEWWIDRSDGPRLPSEAETTYVARPAYRLTYEVVPAASDDDPKSWRAIEASWDVVEPARGSSLGTGSLERRRSIRGPVPGFGLRGFVGVLRVDTAEHVPQTRRVAFGPGAWTREERFELVRRPASEYGTVVVASSLRDAKGDPAPIRLLYQRSTGERSSTGTWLTPTTRPDGTRAFRVPVGRTEVALAADVPLGKLLAWSDFVEVVAGGETAIAFPATPVGSVRLEFRGTWDREVLVTFSRPEPSTSSTWQGLASPDGATLPAVPEGTWKVTTQHGSTSRSQDVSVVAGLEAVVVVEAP